MCPYIVIFGKEVAAYGLMALLGCIAAMGFALWRCSKTGVRRDDELYLIAFGAIGALVGAKVLYQAAHLSELWEYADVIFANPENFMLYLGSGFVFYGGLVGGVIGVIVYARFFGQNTVKLAETFVPGIPLFHFFGRIGCFMAGCCYGIPYDGPFSVTFKNAIGAPAGVALFPIQLVEAAANMVTFAVLLIFERKARRPLPSFGLYLMIYGAERFVFEFFRGDLERGIFLGISTSQWISLVLVPVGFWLFFVSPEKNRLARDVLYGDREK